MELIKKENTELKKIINDININASNLRQIVVNLSTRVLDLENHKNDCIKTMSELRLSLKTNINKNNLSEPLSVKTVESINVNKLKNVNNFSPKIKKNHINEQSTLNEANSFTPNQNLEKNQLNDLLVQSGRDIYKF